jgi:hypothetical protein
MIGVQWASVPKIYKNIDRLILDIGCEVGIEKGNYKGFDFLALVVF